MENVFRIKNKALDSKAQSFLKLHEHKLNYEERKINKLIVMKFKQYSSNDEFIYFIIVYCYYFYWYVDINTPYFNDNHRSYARSMKESLKAEMKWDIHWYLNKMLEMHDDLFLLKITIKSIIIAEPHKYAVFVPNLELYYKSIWWLLPILSFKEYHELISIYQDKYFERVYPDQYKWTKKLYEETISEFDVVENFMVDVMNDLNRIMEEVGLFWRFLVRKKSFFSIYNKIKRKTDSKINDFIWVRIIFKDSDELFEFSKKFENKFVIIKKKDYIKNPKPTWYRALHYNFIYYYWNITKIIEIQLRTEEMNKRASTWKLAHFAYSVNKNKWDPLFKEVQEWLEAIKELELTPQIK